MITINLPLLKLFEHILCHKVSEDYTSHYLGGILFVLLKLWLMELRYLSRMHCNFEKKYLIQYKTN